MKIYAYKQTVKNTIKLQKKQQQQNKNARWYTRRKKHEQE